MIYTQKQIITKKLRYTKQMNKGLLLGIALLAGFTAIGQQKKAIDEVVAVVGNEIILHSDIETQKLQAKQQGIALNKKTECLILEQLLLEKLLLNQARVDSIAVNEQQVQTELERRIRYFVSQIGSEEKLEEYYNKSIIEIKDEFHDLIEDQIRIQGMQAKINEDINITPGEVQTFFNGIPKDSLPYINAKIEMAQIVIKPEISQEEKDATRNRLLDFKKQIEGGKSFASLAVLYSQDPGSAAKGGDLGFVSRGMFVREFDAVAVRLQEGELSEVFESQFGFHLMQLKERRGEQYNARHILLKPKITAGDMVKAENKLDSISKLIDTDSLTFELAAAKFSDDETTKNNGGKLVNQGDGSTEFDMKGVDAQLALTVDKLEIGQISKPVSMQGPDGNQAFRIVKLINRTEPHVANLKDDYLLIKNVATNKLQQESMTEWTSLTIGSTFVKLDESFKDCTFQQKWFKK
jgi:peptidyl-prolyl cis-trans isomerase SurA